MRYFAGTDDLLRGKAIRDMSQMGDLFMQQVAVANGSHEFGNQPVPSMLS